MESGVFLGRTNPSSTRTNTQPQNPGNLGRLRFLPGFHKPLFAWMVGSLDFNLLGSSMLSRHKPTHLRVRSLTLPNEQVGVSSKTKIRGVEPPASQPRLCEELVAAGIAPGTSRAVSARWSKVATSFDIWPISEVGSVDPIESTPTC